jgi:hypothetical protein
MKIPTLTLPDGAQLLCAPHVDVSPSFKVRQARAYAAFMGIYWWTDRDDFAAGTLFSLS